jgi:hypothetical protein
MSNFKLSVRYDGGKVYMKRGIYDRTHISNIPMFSLGDLQ